jgi:hypothetical protein
VERGVKVETLLQKYGLLAHRKRAEEAGDTPVPAGPSTSSSASADPDHHDERSSWWQRALAGSGSSLALAFICNKALFPVRAPITLGLTPAVARALAARGIAVGGGGGAAAVGVSEAARPGGPVPPPRPPPSATQPPPPPPPPQ